MHTAVSGVEGASGSREPMTVCTWCEHEVPVAELAMTANVALGPVCGECQRSECALDSEDYGSPCVCGGHKGVR